MWKQRKRSLALLLLTVALAGASVAGCGQNQGGVTPRQSGSEAKQLPDGNNAGGTQRGNAPGSNMRTLSVDEASLPITTRDGIGYISGQKLVELLEFQSEWQDPAGKLLIGDNDAEYELTGGSQQARRGEDNVGLRNAPVVADGGLLVPVSVLADLFSEDFDYELRDGNVVVRSNPDAIDRSGMDAPADPPGQNDELAFADDPNDPNKDQASPVGAMLRMRPDAEPLDASGIRDEPAVPVLKNIDMNQVIATARRYLGVPYKFGAGPYPQTGRFDCSSFTRYVFAKQGVVLPRTARAQARQGVFVSRNMLRKGDLLFFYVPGRFKSNKIVGHVGIYMGNNLMIHSSPAPKNGVQITNINNAYWKKTFLRAKRVAT